MAQDGLKNAPTTCLFDDAPWLEVWLHETDEDRPEVHHLFNVPSPELSEFIQTVRELRGPVCLSICRPGDDEYECGMCW
jgi:hypothetical protein